VFGALAERRVLVVCAGKISNLVARNLRSRGADIYAVANRSLAHGEKVAQSVGSTAVTLDAIPEVLPYVDVVVSATGAPGFVVDSTTAGPRLQERAGRPLLFVDLAVPRDIDPSLNEVEGCLIYDLDDLEVLVEASLNGRRAEMARAEELVTDEAERFREWQASLTVVSAISSLYTNAEQIRIAELSKAQSLLERLPESDRELVELLTSRIVAKLLHQPTIRMKEAAAAGNGDAYSDVTRRLFGLEE
jgi:glutamyl-tRNA reductase